MKPIIVNRSRFKLAGMALPRFLIKLGAESVR